MLICTHTLQRLKRFLRTTETHKRYHYNSSHVRSQSFATEQWQSAVICVESSQRWVEPNQRSVPNQCSNIRSFSGPNLSAHAKFDRPRHPKPSVLARRDFYFRSARIIIVTHRLANEKESADPPSAPQGCQICVLTPNFTNLAFFRDSWRQKIVSFFSIFGFFGSSWHMLSDWFVFAF